MYNKKFLVLEVQVHEFYSVDKYELGFQYPVPAVNRIPLIEQRFETSHVVGTLQCKISSHLYLETGVPFPARMTGKELEQHLESGRHCDLYSLKADISNDCHYTLLEIDMDF